MVLSSRDAAELAALRALAYGPAPAEAITAAQVQRLAQLEAELAAVPHPEPDQVGGPPRDAGDSDGADTGDRHGPVADEAGAAPVREPRPAISLARLRLGLWAASLVALVVIAASLVAVVPRLQDDPLQTGAIQVARLDVESGYAIPNVFGGGSMRTTEGRGFELFFGMRAIVVQNSVYAPEPDDACLTVFRDSLVVDSQANSFSGRAYYACPAGVFPAQVTFPTSGPLAADIPEELLSAMPDATAFQFVFDPDTDQVVVFLSP